MSRDFREETGRVEDGVSIPIGSLRLSSASASSLDKGGGGECCRVCHCFESDSRGDAALAFLGICPPSIDSIEKDESVSGGSRVVEFVGPGGEVFVCNDLEMWSKKEGDTLIDLGCSCKNDLALVHYACALKWFVNHGSTVCEICGQVAKNISTADLKKVICSLKEYLALGENLDQILPQNSADPDPDVVAAIRRLRLSEVSLFFHPRGNPIPPDSVSMAFYETTEQPSSSSIIPENPVSAENSPTKWAMESTGILVAVGLLTATLAWLIAPRVGKKTAKSGLHVLIAGICALTAVIFFRVVVLTKINYGPARYWAILFIFWFLVFGIWASRTHSAHTT